MWFTILPYTAWAGGVVSVLFPNDCRDAVIMIAGIIWLILIVVGVVGTESNGSHLFVFSIVVVFIIGTIQREWWQALGLIMGAFAIFFDLDKLNLVTTRIFKRPLYLPDAPEKTDADITEK